MFLYVDSTNEVFAGARLLLTVYNCIVYEHDLRLVLLAGAICAISALTAVALLQHVRHSTGRIRAMWTAVTACAIGFGIWSTHFVAMLAFAPDLPSGYDLVLTALSLAMAVAITGLGVTIATWRNTLDHHLVGGATIGFGIAAMHFVGMAAYEVAGDIAWDQRFVAASLVAGVVLGAAAIRIALRSKSPHANLGSAVALTLGICGLHFIAMGAVTITPDASVAVSVSTIPATWLALAVSVAAFTILLLSALALWLDIRDARRARLETARMNGLANAAVEGLVVCDGTTIITANSSFCELVGRDHDGIVATDVSAIVPGFGGDATSLEQTGEQYLWHRDGSRVPAEIVARPIDYAGKRHVVLAVRDLRERKRAEADIRQLALHDPLTGLYNRRAFNDKLDSELATIGTDSRSILALLCLDLDRFKEVNDLFGHAAGDAMLQRVAACIRGILGPGQIVARLGGDEFAVIAPALASEQEAVALAKAILEAFRAENCRASSDGLMSTSVGIAIHAGGEIDRDTLVGQADTALYRAKADGRDTWKVFEVSMGREVRQRRMMEHELRHAVARGEMSLVYQPQKNLKSGETIGYEALLRWKHPSHGMVSPATFVPIAEETGIIVPIGEWVLETACREAARWQGQAMVAVNVSAVQLHSPEFSRTVHQVLLNTGLAPHRLEIEITETALVRDMTRALTTLRQIKALGVRVAMDDFGTGYSSLSNLRAFPFDKIKIDGSFIRSVDRNEHAATIVKAVLGIGRGLGLPVLAEGVETADELRFLAGEFCEIGQGYLLGRPAPMVTEADGTEIAPEASVA